MHIGVHFLYRCNEIPQGLKGIIQAFDDTSNGLMILCVDQDQAKLFMSHKIITCDMTFQRIVGKRNEIVFSIFNEPAKRCKCAVYKLYIHCINIV